MVNCIVGKDWLDISINGKIYKLTRKDQRVKEVIELATKANNVGSEEEIKKYEEQLLELMSPAKRIVSLTDGRFEFDGHNKMYLKATDTPIPEFLAQKLMDFMEGGLPFEPLIKFWMHCLLNPDPLVQQQLFKFLEHNGHPITTNGYFLAYKAVKVKRKFDTQTGEKIVSISYDENTGEAVPEKYTHDLEFIPYHNGDYGMLIKMGTPITMPREDCDGDPNVTCSSGLHVGSMDYVSDFGNEEEVILQVLVNPRNVVSVPVDYNNTKMRVCEYFPISISNGENKKIYMEADYKTQDISMMEKELKEAIEAKNKLIAEIEKEVSSVEDITKQVIGFLNK